MNKLFKHPRETWSAAECLRRSKKINRDGMGTVGGPRGLVSHSGASHPSYGQTIRYNGGCVRGDKWYAGETVPLPVIPKGWRFRVVVSWGTVIEKI